MRGALKHGLARLPRAGSSDGVAVLTYHRVGGGSPDERDVALDQFRRQLDVLADHDVVGLDTACDRLGNADRRPCVVLTFDDGFADVHRNAWPLLRERALPFTLYLATAYLDGVMQWDGSTAREAGRALTWDQVTEMSASGLCTLGNHTHTHAVPDSLTVEEVDVCSRAIASRTGVTSRHFAYPWGTVVPRMEEPLRARFRSAATGLLGRNGPGADLMRLRRIPVRRSDPLEFFRAKLTGGLLAERTYSAMVRGAKAAGLRG